MKKDIVVPQSEGVEIVISPRPDDPDGELWEVWLVNQGDVPLKNILVSSRGYGLIDGREKTTATLRHFIESLEAKSTVLIEPIQTAVFAIANEYWLSYNLGADMLEKKFIFPANTIVTEALTKVDILQREGVTV